MARAARWGPQEVSSSRRRRRRLRLIAGKTIESVPPPYITLLSTAGAGSQEISPSRSDSYPRKLFCGTCAPGADQVRCLAREPRTCRAPPHLADAISQVITGELDRANNSIRVHSGGGGGGFLRNDMAREIKPREIEAVVRGDDRFRENASSDGYARGSVLRYVAFADNCKRTTRETREEGKLERPLSTVTTVVSSCGEARYRLRNLESNVSITDGAVNRGAIPYFKFPPRWNNRTRTFDGNERPRAARLLLSPAGIINIISERPPASYI